MTNADLQLACFVHSQAQPWVESPSRQVLRKRFHLVGAAESGQVTSLVTYQPGASFSSHAHPEGEEILVLEGVFSDEHGDWPAGTWLLNPEGFLHQPFSKDGCMLLVKLRQYTGNRHLQRYWSADFNRTDANAVLLDTYAGSTTRLLTLPAEMAYQQYYADGVEGFVVAGELQLNATTFSQYDWFRLPAGSNLVIRSQGCALYLKENAVTALRQVIGADTDAD